MSRSICRSRVAGFTLIEVLVALAVVATSLAAIGALVAVSVKGTRSLEERLAFTETMRAILTSLPDRRNLSMGTASGDQAGYRWRIDVTPFIASFVDPRLPTPWEPQAVVITVQSPTGRLLQLNTIRLHRRAG